MKQLAKYLLGISIILMGCNDDDSPKRDDRDYLPLETGSWVIYAIEETVYTELNQSTSSAYELKTEIVDSFTNQEGQIINVIHRSKRTDESAPWEVLDTWSVRKNENEAVIAEGITSYIRISFPVYENKQWNGNALNSLPEDLYTCEGKGSPFDLDTGLTFEECLIVNQEEYLDELSKDERLEVYALDVGLIYKKNIELNYCDEGDCFGQQVIKSGKEYIQVLKEHGKN